MLLPYKDELLEVLQLILHLKCVQGYELACQLMRYILRALTLHYPLDYRSVAGSFDRPVSEYLAINVSVLVTGQCDELVFTILTVYLIIDVSVSHCTG